MKNINRNKNYEKKLKILILNRGEIAIRVAKAIRELGHLAIGLYTDSEASGLHLTYCDEWIYLEGQSSLETYCDLGKIKEVIQEYHIDAVHPGYGFLAENVELADLLEKMQVVFIGPHKYAIDVMGDKAKSKKLAKEAKVPTIPGSDGEISSLDEAITVANKIGYPVLLKAVAGGGGRGMRRCDSEEEVKKNYDAVKREAKSSFKNDGLLIEKYITNPHHIEVQVLCDKKGNSLHFFERECSIQRKHQKVIEEAPSPFIGDDEKLRNDICQEAINLAKKVKYDSAGTVEFIMGEDRKFYFLEMNTRIQVEHPVTEAITGVDLLTIMIEVALGLELPFSSQEEIQKIGHSLECRLTLEDPVTFMPSPGKILGMETTFPQGIRFDHCLYAGVDITPHFDPMVGKIISHGYNRDVALRKMKAAIDGLNISGVKTNISLHEKILNHQKFRNGNYTTHFIDEEKIQEKEESESQEHVGSMTQEKMLEHIIATEYLLSSDELS